MKTRLTFLILLSISICARCQSGNSQTDTTQVQYNYLALGDSYTIGESVEENERYPNQLAKALSDAYSSTFKAEIIAQTGWTTADLKNAIREAKLGNRKFDLVTLLIGVNNEFQQRSEEEYTCEFNQLLTQAIGFADGNANRVVVISIPDYGYTPFGSGRQASISSRIDRFNNINKEIAETMNVKYVSITEISRQGLVNPDLVAADGLHPSGMMYKKWVDLLLAELEEAF
ncbi:MAG: lysophospholipase [Candidatus Fluviicola riflensis]|nr:MAG: lysophospholipase [Candidatus Fluviicola riflensis]OGS76458.1 MAG: lysophospholipase [Candidatus Fluviicola riflensis]OGS82752.1 MAG: lysophospholipase [Fluviicola sp. RIFCSPHIGHO2_01_FULL_43_53]OGS89051.1 MAG: lysophospholipase [Fluviicola sp. RIFCSPHIGHO2_12_FULL_43_24]